jgi:hypothetical protein
MVTRCEVRGGKKNRQERGETNAWPLRMYNVRIHTNTQPRKQTYLISLKQMIFKLNLLVRYTPVVAKEMKTIFTQSDKFRCRSCY